ncbi:hypothetical protein [Rickettsiella grylli]|nr:hypothetical protein [Rickettsiella grylli]
MQASRLMNRWGLFGKQIPTDRIAANEAINHINGLRLKRTLAIEQAKSIFDETGELTNEAINNSILITQGNRLGNKQLRDILSSKGNIYDWAKYSTDSTFSPSGNFQVHFYKNNVTGEIYYGMDYKSVFDHQGRWNFELNPSFDYEPPRFNL